MILKVQFIEVNLRKTKWLICGTYHPPSQSDQFYFDNLGNALDIYNEIYNKFLLIGDFNAQDTEPILREFICQNEAKNLVKEGTCFKNRDNPSCIDLFLTNSHHSFQNTTTVFTGLSDFHKMVLTVIKSSFPKGKPKQISIYKYLYMDYKTFYELQFKEELYNHYITQDIATYNSFEDIFIKVLDKYAPLKKKLVRANNAP